MMAMEKCIFLGKDEFLSTVDDLISILDLPKSNFHIVAKSASAWHTPEVYLELNDNYRLSFFEGSGYKPWAVWQKRSVYNEDSFYIAITRHKAFECLIDKYPELSLFPFLFTS